MKQRVSICAVAVRQVIWKLLTVVLCLTLCQLWFGAKHLAEQSFAAVVEQSGMDKLYWLAVAAVTVVLCWQGMDRTGKLRYTLGRLPVKEETITMLWAIIFLGCYILLWAWEISLTLVVWQMYCRWGGTETTGLELVVSTYCNGFLHSLLPMKDWLRWISCIVYYGTLALSAARFGYSQRRGTLSWGIVVVFFLQALFFELPMGYLELNVLALLCLGVVLYWNLAVLWRKQDEEN